MADNVVLNAGSGGSTLAADDITSVLYQRVKLVEGADGVNDGDVSAANPLPVELRDADGTAAADITSIKAAVELIDNAVSGTELQVDIVAALPAGTNAIGKLASNTGVDIGDVDVLSLPASTNTIEVVGDAAENAAVAGNPVLSGGRYDLTPRTLGDGDVGAIALDADGAVQVADGGNSLTIDGTVTANLSATDNAVLDNIQTSVDSIAAAVSTEMQVDVVAALPAGTNAIGKLAANTGVDIGDVDVLSVAGTVTVDGSAVIQPVSGTVTANLSATDNAVLDNIQTAVDTVAAAVSTEMQVDVVGSLPAGTAAIGKLAANSGVDIGDVDVTSQPARARATDTISAAIATDAIMSDSTALTPKFVNISTAASGDTALVAAVAAKTIRVLSLSVFAFGTANTLYFNDGTASVFADATNKIPIDKTGAAGAGGFVLAFNPLGHFQTAAVNRPININLGAAQGVTGCMTYVEV